jgi:hypothetical protein
MSSIQGSSLFIYLAMNAKVMPVVRRFHIQFINRLAKRVTMEFWLKTLWSVFDIVEFLVEICISSLYCLDQSYPI